MPHVDGISLVPGYRRSGESLFAGPVAAITSVVVSSFERARTALARWQARRSEQALLHSYAHKSWEISRGRSASATRTMRAPPTSRTSNAWNATGTGATAAACGPGIGGSAK